MNDERKPTRFEIRLSPALADQIDQWRAKQPGLPNRAEAARRLIEMALRKDPMPDDTPDLPS